MSVCGGGDYRQTTAIKTPFPKAAVHVAGVFDPEEQVFTLFVDGQRKTVRPFCRSFKPSPTALVIGAAAPHWKLHGKKCPESPSDVIAGFRGTIDEVRISKTARYSEDFTPELPLGSDASTIALYHFDEGTGTVAKDSSDNPHDGIITGAEWVATDCYTPPTQVGPPKPSSDHDELDGSIDLLALVKLPRDAGNGVCGFDGRGFVLYGNDPWGGLRLPYAVPDDYAVMIEAICFKSGAFYLWIPTDRGVLSAYFDHSNRSGLSFSNDAAQWTVLTEEATKNRVFPMGRRVRIRCVVQRDGSNWKVNTFADGRMVSTGRLDATEMPMPPSVTTRPKARYGLNVSTYKGGYRIESLRIQPLKGEGHPIFKDEAPNADRSVAWHIARRGNPIWISDGTNEPVRIETPKDLPPRAFHLTGVEFRNRKYTSFYDLLVLSELSRLKKIDLCGQKWLRGADVRKWLHLPALEELDLANTWISDEDIRKLPGLPRLRVLDLSFTNVTDNGLRALLQCTNLERLILRGTQITDHGMRHVAELRSLKELDLSGTSITDRGLQTVSRIGSLERLVLDHTALSDVGLSHLSQAANLKFLSLTYVRITDEGLRELAELPALEELCLIGIDISAENLASLRQTMQSCNIHQHLGGEIDLLEAIRVERDAVQGEWRYKEGPLVSPAKDNWARLQVPYVPPDEYILKVTFRRQSGKGGAFNIGLPSCGRQFRLKIAGDEVRGSGLDLLDGGDTRNNPTSYPDKLIVNNEATEVIVTIRKSHIMATVDGKLVVDWEGDFKRLSLVPYSTVPREDSLFLGNPRNSHVISRLSLTPISGTGRFLDDSSVAAPQKEEEQEKTGEES